MPNRLFALFSRFYRGPRQQRPREPAPRPRRHCRGCGGVSWVSAQKESLKTGSAEHASLRREAEEDLAYGLEMDRAALALLGPGVDVA
jgi:hypothetical protein